MSAPTAERPAAATSRRRRFGPDSQRGGAPAWESTRLALLALSLALTLPITGAYLLDLLGLTLRAANLAAAVAVQLALVALALGRPSRVEWSTARLAGLLLDESDVPAPIPLGRAA